VGLKHFYHLYADGHWLKAASTHFEAADQAGLLQACATYVGIVGKERDPAIAWLGDRATIIAEADTGWEQVTLTAMLTVIQAGDLVCYAHTKGAGYPSDLATAWRYSMTYDVICRWRERVQDLQQHQASGPFWLKSDMPEHRDHRHFFAGNFWWARADYLLTLDPPLQQTRYQAEGWIGFGDPIVACCRPGLSYWGNFYDGDLTWP